MEYSSISLDRACRDIGLAWKDIKRSLVNNEPQQLSKDSQRIFVSQDDIRTIVKARRMSSKESDADEAEAFVAKLFEGEDY